jgi:membrane-bound lytic murein transglycosylase D
MTVCRVTLYKSFLGFLLAIGLPMGLHLGRAVAQPANLLPPYSPSAVPADPTITLSPTKAVVGVRQDAPGALLSSPGAPHTSASAPFVLSPARQAPPFPIVLNRAVQRYIDDYTRNIGQFRAHFFGMYPFFRDMMRVLTSYGVPTDFIYLAFAESAFAGYRNGPWQLTKSTARDFGLRVNRWVDERLDPLKSTRAAAEYLASLHDLLGDWRLTIVAWNTGENSALPLEDLKRADYSELSEILPRRTRALLNRFMAVAFIAHHPLITGVDLAAFADDSAPSNHCLITVPPGTSLQDAARMAHTTVGVIRALNPALLRDRVPPNESYKLRVPLMAESARSAQRPL